VLLLLSREFGCIAITAGALQRFQVRTIGIHGSISIVLCGSRRAFPRHDLFECGTPSVRGGADAMGELITTSDRCRSRRHRLPFVLTGLDLHRNSCATSPSGLPTGRSLPRDVSCVRRALLIALVFASRYSTRHLLG